VGNLLPAISFRQFRIGGVALEETINQAIYGAGLPGGHYLKPEI